ncbi:uncharacterized protein PG986_012546 [Apiospora aurea]|uniref:Uncharacterized protein n=1 Tax=Apiospora aurea TaxID=335848 RepID=A0ABR1Q0B8_9PEZI
MRVYHATRPSRAHCLDISRITYKCADAAAAVTLRTMPIVTSVIFGVGWTMSHSYREDLLDLLKGLCVVIIVA